VDSMLDYDARRDIGRMERVRRPDP